MTREDAIQALKDLRDIRLQGVEWTDALDMAIEALSADTVPIEKYHELQHQFVMLGATFADLTEVVRCKDCEHWDTADGECYGHDHYHCSEANDYCSHGELADQTYNKLPGYDEIMDRLDNLKLEFTIHGTERIRRIKEDDND